ncbi:MAG TPA: hypothetical protein PKD99_01045 [Sphingopyxis sp.]|nr:hypothetical protein [Sphingopyxis sp.]HMP43661.1 hypothetical protein [Sphingopyxis sp.]HMQ20717.1 hypothetical protein [Sphingopyxis sp.]
MSLALALAALATPAVSCPSGSIAKECSRADVAKKISLAPDRVAKIADTCLYDYGGRCSVEASGRINGSGDGPALLWQKLALAPRDGPAARMVILLSEGAAGKAALAGFAESTWTLGAPDLVDDGGERSLVHVTGTLAGSGAGNADALFAADGPAGRWRQIDISGWHDQGSAMLPAGYWLRGPIRFIFAEMFASIPVARDGDGNCCPQGGTAFVDLDIEGDRLVITGLRFQPMQPVGAEVEYPPRSRD